MGVGGKEGEGVERGGQLHHQRKPLGGEGNRDLEFT